jgi:predicted metalloprotease
MRLKGIGRSRNVEDRRGRGGGGGGAKIGGFGLLLVLAIGYFAGIDVTPLLQGQDSAPQATRAPSAAEEHAAEFSARVLATTESVWADILPAQAGRDYRPPILVLYSGVLLPGGSQGLSRYRIL